MADALKCLGPQGINGFGYEAPLETMRRILEDNVDGFVRDEALLAIIIVTDEADCSMPFENVETLFTPLGEPFWADLEPSPTSSACWKAGVSCLGGPGTYDACVAVDKGWDGLPANDPNAAVLYPLDRYIQALQNVADRKEALGGNGTVSVAVISGVPEDYPQGGELIYRDSADPIFNSEYGIGPGCGYGTETLGDLPGIPPVRLKQFAESFAGRAAQHVLDLLGRLRGRAAADRRRDRDAGLALVHSRMRIRCQPPTCPGSSRTVRWSSSAGRAAAATSRCLRAW
jgi:hypothetical protein